MKKKALILGLAVLFIGLFSTFLFAAPWSILVDGGAMCIYTIDLGTATPTVYGPFLSGSLGSGTNELTDVAIIPRTNYALVSHFHGYTIYRIDISNPTNPVLAGSINIGFEAEDIAISPNGQFAVVSDGNLGTKLAFINLNTFTLNGVYTLTTGGANAVAVAPDNQTIIIADFYNNRIIYGAVNPGINGLVSENTLSAGSNPINVSISPDGSTVLVPNANGNSVSVYRITSPGTVIAGTTPTVSGLPGSPQSVAFSPNGTRAYVVSSNSPDQLSWLQINGPGDVSLGGAGVSNLIGNNNGGVYFGVDVLAITSDGNYALASNPATTLSQNNISLVNLNTFAVTTVNVNGDMPAGVDIIGNEVGIPTLNEWGIMIFILSTTIIAFYHLKRKNRI